LSNPVCLDRITSYLKVIAPEIDRFEYYDYDTFETIRFVMKLVVGQPQSSFDKASMSDGTLRVLVALVAVFQVVLPSCNAGFIGIEEPETALHPAAMHALLDAMQEATLYTQIILTTHSPDFLDNRDISPRQVLVVRSVNGKTEIAPMDKVSREIIKKEYQSLADLQRFDQISIDEDYLLQTPQAFAGGIAR
jgi:predicted ATPase